MLAAEFIDGCLANTCNVYQPEIVVPPVPATDVVSSKILHITYELKVWTNMRSSMRLLATIKIETIEIEMMIRFLSYRTFRYCQFHFQWTFQCAINMICCFFNQSYFFVLIFVFFCWFLYCFARFTPISVEIYWSHW